MNKEKSKNINVKVGKNEFDWLEEKSIQLTLKSDTSITPGTLVRMAIRDFIESWNKPYDK